ncbi:HIT family protein [Saccharothrix texasensis]|uniref:HIT family protein n=1 Tax=Saccharothrix texasensis TaxID=103734 RepID=UPI000F4C16E6|nr:HIT family protein [Saccharothrix texasensis]
MSENSCAFCSDEMRSSEFAGNADFAAVYNIAPIVPGHSLVIPRRHIQRIEDLSEEEFSRYWIFAREVTKFLLDTFKTNAFDWTIQEQEAAGQTVPHLHLHIIPRVPGDFDDPGGWYPKLRHGAIVDHAHEVIDSKDRVRLTLSERERIARELATQWDLRSKRS